MNSQIKPYLSLTASLSQACLNPVCLLVNFTVRLKLLCWTNRVKKHSVQSSKEQAVKLEGDGRIGPAFPIFVVIRVWRTGTGNSRYREFFIFLLVSESEQIGTGKKSRNRYRKNLVPEKSFGTGIWPQAPTAILAKGPWPLAVQTCTRCPGAEGPQTPNIKNACENGYDGMVVVVADPWWCHMHISCRRCGWHHWPWVPHHHHHHPLFHSSTPLSGSKR